MQTLILTAPTDEVEARPVSPFLGRPPSNVAYATSWGRMLHGKSDEILSDGSLARFEGKVNLIFTSPPFPLNRKKRYGNETGESYIRWLCTFGPLFKKMLTPDGSIVIEMGNSWEPGMPVMSTLALRALLDFQTENDLYLCQEFIWQNPAKLPSQSRLNYGNLIDDVLREEGQPLTVSIVHDRPNKTLTITDNSIGMSREDLVAALRIAHPTPDSKGRSKYGMGMKTAACWIGAHWTVTTCELGSGEEWTATIDVDAIANHGAKVPMTMRAVSRDDHYTRITISKLRRVIQTRSEQTIKDYLGSMYMFDLRPGDKGQVAMKLTYNGEEVLPPQESEWDTDPSGTVMKRDLPSFTIDGKVINGWIGVLRKGGRKYGGFSMFQNGRQIQGYPSAWKPSVIFGGVDDEGANNLIAQRLTGVLMLDGFGVSHTKDKVLFEGEEEEALEKFLVKETKDYVEYAKSRRGTGRGAKWSKDQVRDLVKDMQSEFTSPEMKDALNNAVLPPLDVITANNQQQLQTLTAEDEIGRLEILPDLKVIISLKETSPYEPHVVFVPGAPAGVLHVIINGLHPYYQTLEAKDAIAECVQQYIFDAVAEFKTSKLTARVNPDSVRNLKNGLLRARAEQLDNADTEVRAQAEAELFGRKAAS